MNEKVIDTSGPQNLPDELPPVELEEPSDPPNVDYDPDTDPTSRREWDNSSPEPEVAIISPDSVSALKQIAEFAIIARGLFLNWKNQEIIDELSKANHPMSIRKMQRMTKLPEFQAYYQQYRGGMLSGIDDRVMSLFKQVGPEAAAKVVKLMRGATAERLQYDASMAILKEGGFIARDDVKTPPISITVEALKQLIGEGNRVLKPIDVEATVIDSSENL